ncbi:SigE family RNA polymerase sigma factor [Dactylosporangium roseum]|uniref:SigE family RNA polymerase sigma factor n=1 Tax=Dactylosporangium roseum TaxID=47989 RepID=A0ABY5Z223_9ACTN|nr:SigE family RNA polymerase sigma factor [Dactylosporangium roseum]UWZ34917.1 SigE family RNA polymerase sigma factor [Dactylosporangium roseum]
MVSQRGEEAPEEHVRAWSADGAVTMLFSAHYRGLVRLAVLLLHDESVAEDVVQDAYVALHRRWWRLRDTDKALAYLRTSVVNGARSALRHRGVADRYVARGLAGEQLVASAETGALSLLRHREVLDAVRRLPARQREAIVLRYYAELSEAEIADAMRVSRGAVKSHAARGLAALRESLEHAP